MAVVWFFYIICQIRNAFCIFRGAMVYLQSGVLFKPWPCLDLQILSKFLAAVKLLSGLIPHILESWYSLLFHFYPIILLKLVYFRLHLSPISIVKFMVVLVHPLWCPMGVIPDEFFRFVKVFCFGYLLFVRDRGIERQDRSQIVCLYCRFGKLVLHEDVK